MGELVQTGELADFLHQPVSSAPEVMAIRVAEGWLSSVCLNRPPWPDPVPEDLWAWALELAAMAYTNPSGMQARTTDEETRTWGLGRRREILEAAAQKYGDGAGAASTTGGPSGVEGFPIALQWPDPPVVGW